MKKNIAAAVLLGAITAPAWAVPFTTTLPDNLGPLNGGVVSYNVAAPGASNGDATLTFDLLGYLSVDGVNCCTDTFSLTINGNLMFSGGFNMGGGGWNFINYIDPGVTILSSSTPGVWQGGVTKFSVAHDLLAGNNSYVFNYGYMQGLGDEGWGLDNAVITADVNVPEPASVALLGLGLVGLAAARRKKNA